MSKKIVDPAARVLMWRRLDQFGLERVAIGRSQAGHRRFTGTVLTVNEATPVLIRYVLLCDEDWSSQYLALDVRRAPGASLYVQLVNFDTGRWQFRQAKTRNAIISEPFHDLALPPECIDIDLGFSPLTNTLPLRRLRPRVGSRVETTAVWIRFPELDVQPLRQRYYRQSLQEVVYESLTGFQATLSVDAFGYVIRYDDLWERVAAADVT
jgi:hypothetical protein